MAESLIAEYISSATMPLDIAISKQSAPLIPLRIFLRNFISGG
jgi:hypothetical protein